MTEQGVLRQFVDYVLSAAQIVCGVSSRISIFVCLDDILIFLSVTGPVWAYNPLVGGRLGCCAFVGIGEE